MVYVCVALGFMVGVAVSSFIRWEVLRGYGRTMRQVGEEARRALADLDRLRARLSILHQDFLVESFTHYREDLDKFNAAVEAAYAEGRADRDAEVS